VAFFSSLGSELRLRFEWHRIKHPLAPGAPAAAPSGVVSSDPRSDESRRSFNELVSSMASDLSVLSAPGSAVTQGYQPYLFRIGVGMTTGGTFGIVKSDATAIGQVYFSRDVPKPSTIAVMSVPTGTSVASPIDGELNLIEPQALPSHLDFARQSGVQADGDTGALGQVVYRVNRSQLRKGLARAEKMAGFFARRGSKVRSGHWGLYEIRASFDMSLAGTLGIVTATGLATAEIDLYNEGF
jgi:hypothetical protein